MFLGSIKESIMNVTEPANLEKEGEREREENIADLQKPLLPTFFIPKEPYLHAIINANLERLTNPPASSTNDSLNYGA